MNVGALPELILAWFRNQGADLLQPAKDKAVPGQFNLGQQYDGQVLENMPNGRSLVQVADQKLDMALPQQAKPGDILRLTYVQSGPRPTFVLSAATVTASQSVTVSQAAQQVSALTRYVPVEGAAPAPAAAAQVAMTATQTAASSAQMAAATRAGAKPILANPAVLLVPTTPVAASQAVAIQGAVPSALAMTEEAVEGMYAAKSPDTSVSTAQGVMAGQPSVSHMLPMRLQQTLKESGLFYESHLGKWVRGEVGMESIQREPQAKLAQTPGPLLNLPDLEGMPEKAASIASRQLNMLDGGPFVWQGQIWPGQHMEWQVTEREANGKGMDQEAQKWQSKLRLTLPRLGGLTADLDIGARGLRVRLNAQAPGTLDEIKAALPELAQRMKSAELNLTSLTAELADGTT